MLLFALVLALGLTNQLSFASKNFFDSGLQFYNPLITNNLDWQLLQELSVNNKNVLISPISLKLILALLYQGSSSIAEREFQTLLNFENKDDVKGNFSEVLSALQSSSRSEYLLNIGTSMFIDSDLQLIQSFKQIANEYFRTGVKSVDFSKSEEASKVINGWIEQLTHGKVKKMVDASDIAQTLMLITNAIYFKGTWEHPFPKDQTVTGRFLTSADYQSAQKTPKYVKYMTTTDQFYYYEDQSLDAKILRLKYKGSDYSMFIVLPNSLGGLDSLIKKITLSKISFIRYNMQEELVQVTIPKFRFNFYSKIAHILKKFGLQQIFQNANSFSGIVETKNSLRNQLVVTDIIQKTGIEVDEEGSVIFAATDVNIGNKFGENKILFNASHPFMFFVEGPSGSIIFIGKYEDPQELEGAEMGGNLDADISQLFSESGNMCSNSQQPVPAKKENCNLVCKLLDYFSLNEKKETANTGNAQFYPNNYNKNQVSITNGFVSTDRFSDPKPISAPAPDYSLPDLSPNLDPSYYETSDANMNEIASRFNLFDMEFLNGFTDSHSNILISPASVKTTLAMILEGAKGNCADEIKEALRIPDLNQKGVRSILTDLLNNLNEKATTNTFLESHNGIFTSNKVRLLESYKKVVTQYYNAEFKDLDFSNAEKAANEINQWVSTATHGAIDEIVTSQSISPETFVIISNALYFKGKWKTSFDVRSTSTKPFCTPQMCTDVKMMHISDNFNYNYVNSLRAYVVEIPYQDKFSMLLILPSPDTNVRSVIRDLPHYTLSGILSTLNKSEIVLELPRFSFEYSVDLVEYLKMSAKIKDVFGPKANLSGIVQGNNAMVNNMLHKTKIEVDEHGTVAAASTSAMIVPLMQPVTVSADRPFIFMIYHQQTKNIIFEGVLQNPRELQNSNSYQARPQSKINRRF